MSRPEGRLRATVFVLGALSALCAVLILRGGPAPMNGAESGADLATKGSLLSPSGRVAFEPAAAGVAPSGFVVRGNGFAARLEPAGARFRLRDAAGSYARTGFRLLGANGDSAGAGTDLLPGRSHYYPGNDPAAWRVNVPHYARVTYASVYPGIDMAWHGEQGGLEFDFIVAPGADPAPIRLGLDGTRPARLDPAGDLWLATATGELRLRRPVAYQESSGRRESVDAAFELDPAGRELRFRLGSYDASRRLIIDPVIAYADYLGGGSDDSGLALAVDAGGNRYVAGGTASVDFADEAKSDITGKDVFVAKLAPDGTRLYVTFIEGSGADQANAITVDSGGEAYIAGDTTSGNLASSGGAVQAGYGGNGDAFVARLATDGTLEYLSYLGGAAQDNGRAIALSATGDMIVGGSTLSSNFPIQTVVQPTIGGQSDGFVTRINATGTALVYSTYHGGVGPENVAALAVDETDAVYFGGTTGSQDTFPTTPGAFQTTFQGGILGRLCRQARAGRLRPGVFDLPRRQRGRWCTGAGCRRRPQRLCDGADLLQLQFPRHGGHPAVCRGHLRRLSDPTDPERVGGGLFHLPRRQRRGSGPGDHAERQRSLAGGGRGRDRVGRSAADPAVSGGAAGRRGRFRHHDPVFSHGGFPDLLHLSRRHRR
ncbi:MAG: hypothetical protein IPM20_13810 [Gammaproteobacteria bacterium]|nr:hypothetical protein [Gammaproteobacteria bacterium]